MGGPFSKVSLGKQCFAEKGSLKEPVGRRASIDPLRSETTKDKRSVHKRNRPDSQPVVLSPRARKMAFMEKMVSAGVLSDEEAKKLPLSEEKGIMPHSLLSAVVELSRVVVGLSKGNNTRQAIEQHLAMSEQTVLRNLKTLKKEGIISKAGSAKNLTYSFTAKYADMDISSLIASLIQMEQARDERRLDNVTYTAMANSLKENKWNLKAAAKAVGLSRGAIYNRFEDLIKENQLSSIATDEEKKTALREANFNISKATRSLKGKKKIIGRAKLSKDYKRYYEEDEKFREAVNSMKASAGGSIAPEISGQGNKGKKKASIATSPQVGPPLTGKEKGLLPGDRRDELTPDPGLAKAIKDFVLKNESFTFSLEELAAKTDIPQADLSTKLPAFLEKGYITQDGEQYSPAGEFFAEMFEVSERMIDVLRQIENWRSIAVHEIARKLGLQGGDILQNITDKKMVDLKGGKGLSDLGRQALETIKTWGKRLDLDVAKSELQTSGGTKINVLGREKDLEEVKSGLDGGVLVAYKVDEKIVVIPFKP